MKKNSCLPQLHQNPHNNNAIWDWCHRKNKFFHIYVSNFRLRSLAGRNFQRWQAYAIYECLIYERIKFLKISKPKVAGLRCDANPFRNNSSSLCDFPKTLENLFFLWNDRNFPCSKDSSKSTVFEEFVTIPVKRRIIARPTPTDGFLDLFKISWGAVGNKWISRRIFHVGSFFSTCSISRTKK